MRSWERGPTILTWGWVTSWCHVTGENSPEVVGWGPWGLAEMECLIFNFKSICICLFVCFLLRATLRAYGSSQARGQILATVASLHHSHSNAGSELSLRPTPQQHKAPARSLTCWARPGIEPLSSWILVGLVTAEPQRELPFTFVLLNISLILRVPG